jgi:hypothetical protein
MTMLDPFFLKIYVQIISSCQFSLDCYNSISINRSRIHLHVDMRREKGGGNCLHFTCVHKEKALEMTITWRFYW